MEIHCAETQKFTQAKFGQHNKIMWRTPTHVPGYILYLVFEIEHYLLLYVNIGINLLPIKQEISGLMKTKKIVQTGSSLVFGKRAYLLLKC